MNVAVRIRQLARAFVDAQSITPSTEQLLRLIEEARLVERMSTPAVLPLPLRDPGAPPTSAMRFTLASAQLDWQLALLNQSFDLTRLPTDMDGTNIGDLGEFASMAASTLWDCARFFGRLPHRLVLGQSGFMGEMSSEQLDSVARRLLHVPTSFDAPPPFEWDWRCARYGAFTIRDRNERTNIVATIKRTSGVMQSATEKRPFDRIFVELDVNTLADDARGRFEEHDMKQFFVAAVAEHSRLADELDTFAFKWTP
jgi:hypothetical protein